VNKPTRLDPLYVGYQPVAPPWVAQRVRRVVVGVMALVVAVALVRAASQGPVSAKRFEYDQLRGFEGVLSARPVPALLVARPGRTAREAAYSRYVLVGEGKHGAGSIVSDLDAHAVRLAGQLIYRENQTMLQVASRAVTNQSGPGGIQGSVESAEQVGLVTVSGEIVDSKCFLGAMNPATRTIHRGCAVRCLSGGVPPLVVIRDSVGLTSYLYLTGPKGEAVNKAILDLVGVPVTITGRVERRGDLLVLMTDPATIRRTS
jgi:hypothetical protein